MSCTGLLHCQNVLVTIFSKLHNNLFSTQFVVINALLMVIGCRWRTTRSCLMNLVFIRFIGSVNITVFTRQEVPASGTTWDHLQLAVRYRLPCGMYAAVCNMIVSQLISAAALVCHSPFLPHQHYLYLACQGLMFLQNQSSCGLPCSINHSIGPIPWRPQTMTATKTMSTKIGLCSNKQCSYRYFSVIWPSALLIEQNVLYS